MSDPVEQDMISSTSEDSSSSKDDNDDNESIDDLPTAIDSFVPLIQVLDSPVVHFIGGEYHLRGPISLESLEKLSTYAQSVTSFTVSDDEPSLIPETLWRLIRLLDKYHWNNNLKGIFPSLDELCITDADASLDLLGPLFTVSSLRYLEIYGVPEARRDTLLTFLYNLANDAPNMYSIKLDGALPYKSALHSSCMKFLKLRELHLEKVGPELDWTTLRDIGQLPELEALVLSANGIIYTPQHNAQSVPLEMAEPIESEKTKIPHPSEPTFRNLKSLHLVAKIDLMSDLVGLIESKEMTTFSLTLISTRNVSMVQSGVAELKPGFTEDTPLEPKQFTSIVKSALATGPHTLTTFRIVGRRPSPTKVGKFSAKLPILMPYTLLALLLHSSLRSLEVSRWTVTWDLGKVIPVLSTSGRPSKFRSLHFPIGKGIPLSMLHPILKSCPALVSLKCRFIKPSVIPACPSDNDIYGLKTLGAGSMKVEHYELPEMTGIAQYLDALCPSLESIEFEKKDGQNCEQWKQIHNFVKMCQHSRSYHAAARNPVKPESWSQS
ncbi:hypothetical protein BDN70DRAFT_989699 [Pholiota conissans]|uniref:Uncharacterized protein n=1 Tax=Pholiota conissans TaxID=109636 RepID=A0A9P6D5Q9_9AGAR|nr:hypothetical protein BDN70DRAFT_989699 [Pholiota conissans]